MTPRPLAISRRIFRLFTVLSLAVLLALSVLAAPLLRILAAPPYQGADRVVPYLVVSTVFANMFMFAPGLVIAERTRAMAKYTAAVGVANLVLAWFSFLPWVLPVRAWRPPRRQWPGSWSSCERARSTTRCPIAGGRCLRALPSPPSWSWLRRPSCPHHARRLWNRGI